MCRPLNSKLRRYTAAFDGKWPLQLHVAMEKMEVRGEGDNDVSYSTTVRVNVHWTNINTASLYSTTNANRVFADMRGYLIMSLSRSKRSLYVTSSFIHDKQHYVCSENTLLSLSLIHI